VPGTGLEAQQLVELLAVVSACPDESSAVRAAAERAAETVEAELGAVVLDGTVVVSVGLPSGVPDDLLGATRPRRPYRLEVPRLGECSIAVAPLGAPGEGTLVIGRVGEEISVAEYSLIRGMAKVLGLTLRMLRTIDAERRRQALMQSLHQVQRGISRRVPLAEVLQMITDAAVDVLARGYGHAELWLAGPGGPGQLTRTCVAGPGDESPPAATRPVSLDWPAGAAVLGDQPVSAGDTTAVPVHEHGRTIGVLSSTRPGGRPHTPVDEELLLALAEHASIALSDAKAHRETQEALHDSLTGLPGRTLFLRTLQDRLARGSAPAVLFVDLDLFKEVNDTLGHAAGDAVLMEFAVRLRRVIGVAGTAARLGGDEFAVCLDGASHEHATRVAGWIIAEAVRPFMVPDGPARIGASVGIAAGAVGDRDEQDLIRRADVAMYRAKQKGRGHVVLFEPEMQDDRHRRRRQGATVAW
jgi:diguanylate cyclase (GGDEF)-like protein